MKNTCLFLLAVLFGLGIFYYSYLSGTELKNSWWIGPLLALSVVLFLSNLQGVYFAIRQKILSGKNESQWKDGDLIALSGRVQAIGDPLIAPFSERRAVMVEYSVKYTTQSSSDSSSSTTTKTLDGMLMTPCIIQTSRRSVRIIGFPIFANIHPQIFSDESHYRNAVKYILSNKFEEMPANPLKILSQLNEILADDDGDLKANFRNKNFDLDILNESDDGENTASTSEIEESLYQTLISKPYDLEETCVENTAQVTIFGTYRAAKQAVDIGSGLKNIQHAIHLGKIEDVIRKNLIKSFIFTLIFGGISAAAHFYVAKLLGFSI